MKRTVILASLVTGGLFAGARQAEAQMPAPGTARGIGLGMAAMLDGPGLGSSPAGLSFAYDGGAWHLDTILSLTGNGDTTYSFGVRGWFHLHQTPGADFSVGGGLGVRHHGDTPSGDDENSVHLDAGFLIRAFLTPAVALSAFGGIGIVPSDDSYEGFALTGQLGGFGGFGLHYYFQ